MEGNTERNYEKERTELELKQVAQTVNSEPRVNGQEIIRRNIEAMCTIWKTWNGSTHHVCPEVMEELKRNIMDHVKMLTPK